MTAGNSSDVKKYVVIGDPVGHSLSPGMQNAAFRARGLPAEYTAVRVLKEDLGAFAADASKRLAGFNITVPHKNNILPFLSGIDPTARASGSVNTVKVQEDGGLYGFSTDGYGLEHAVLEAGGPALKGSTICFIGCGGVTPALAFHAAAAGAGEIRILNRTVEKAEALCTHLRECYAGLRCEAASLACAGDLMKGAELTVQCTSLGLKQEDPAPADPALLSGDTFLFDLVYRETKILAGARARGIRCADGLAMLLHQGAKSFEIWTGCEAPLEEMRSVLYREAAARR